jgi:hypothetical protein
LSLRKALKKVTAPITKVTSAVQNLTQVVQKPLVNLKETLSNPKSLLDPVALAKQEIQTGKEMGKALEATAVALNPLDHTLEKRRGKIRLLQLRLYGQQ